MNVYFLGMCISMTVYIVLGKLISKTVKTADDYYVAGRRAPLLLIAGSMIASYTSTGMFMGDAAEAYEGAFAPMIVFASMQSAGYIIGAVFFGRYLRRMGVMTIPEYFGKRFQSTALKKLAAITAIITMGVYLLSVMQGIGTLMNAVTGLDYNLCITIALAVFTYITVISGSSGVLITDTLMASLFTLSLIVSILFISNYSGGWFSTITAMASNPASSQMLSWAGKPGALYDTGLENLAWGLIYGIVWMSVCMVGPWQSSRYLMAKNEHVIVRSSFIAAIGVFALEFMCTMSAVFVYSINPNIEPSSMVMVWAAMNIVPKVLGIVLLTGVLAAGISSATTFLSLIGASFANDILEDSEHRIRNGQIAMLIVSAVVLVLSVANPPAIFWIMIMGASVIAASWMPVALASVLSKRVTKTGVFAGMFLGYIACFSLRLYSVVTNITLPIYLDPAFVGMIVNVIALIIGTAMTRPGSEEVEAWKTLFVIPENERDPAEMKKTLTYTKLSALIGVGLFVVLMVLWILPYLRGL